MEVPKDVYTRIRDMVTEFHGNPSHELEAKFAGRMTKDAFTRVLQYLRSSGFREDVLTETLDILFIFQNRPCRLSVAGKDAIQQYCISNRLDARHVTEAVAKTFVQGFATIFLDDLQSKVDLRNERKLTEFEVQEAAIACEKALKGYRYKKRFSYVSADKMFRFDCTVVKRSQDDNRQFMVHPKFTTSGVTQASEQYEVEIECVQRGKTEDVAKKLLAHIATVYTVSNGLSQFISRSQQETILRAYLSLWMSKAKEVDMSQLRMKPRRFFLGPQPVTLEQKNVVVDGGLGMHTILKNYTVTEKADGERCLFYIHTNHQGYFLNSKLEVHPSGMSFPNLQPSIVDGEWITRDSVGNKVRIFAMFDMYFHDGERIMSLPLLEDEGGKGTKTGSRLGHLRAFFDKYKDRFHKETQIQFQVKRFLHGADIFEQAKTILDQVTLGHFVYRIDGLIFTPKNLAVGGDFQGDQGDMMGTWNKLFKWKPPAENTIDFQVREQRDDVGKVKVATRDGKVYKMFQLFVGFKPSQWEGITARAFLDKKVKKNHTYVAKLFTPPEEVDPMVAEFYGEVDAYGTCRCKNGDEITFNAIIEFAYLQDASLPMPYRWVPLRVRKDKTAPNDFGPAINVWRSIHYPVTQQVMTGKHQLFAKDLFNEEVYYKRTIQRDKFASKAMMNFHTYWNKNVMLLQGYCKGSKRLLDLACGKGGDIRKWADAGIEHVLGIDSVRDNIENPVDGAYARLMDYKLDKNYVFLTMDASKPMDKVTIDMMKNEDDRIVARRLWGLGDASKAPYVGMAAQGFDVVTCMFAIHYFFASERTLDTFLKNVSTHLQEGGLFLGTCLDGKRVKEALKHVPLQQSLTGRSEDGRVMWNIQKLYTNEDPVDIQFGEEVRIYMESIGREATEPLVNMSTLIQKLAAYNIHPVNIQGFDVSYQQVLKMDHATVNQSMLDAVKHLSEAEKQYSFLNTFFVFQKGKPAPAASAKKLVVKKK